ncbi:hypothetical protein M404DRAFT_1003845 [Pisolithus tinctorius Marx 270]|uniref:Uncharacterized protein n=1 Tax=Pisolithus tinctorius Marx 270 TaxID=870435 RepID=A0A0C3JSF3_PISTI|nr:hypothetical protein M404DRAFT_1003845 [Pisolithus tinctorius Marx 270]
MVIRPRDGSGEDELRHGPFRSVFLWEESLPCPRHLTHSQTPYGTGNYSSMSVGTRPVKMS